MLTFIAGFVSRRSFLVTREQTVLFSYNTGDFWLMPQVPPRRARAAKARRPSPSPPGRAR